MSKLRTTLLWFAALMAVSTPSQAKPVSESVIARHESSLRAAASSRQSLHSTRISGKAVPLVCDPDSNTAVSAHYVNNDGLALQLNGGGDPNDIVGTFIDGFAGQPLNSVQIDFSGPCLPANGAIVPEGPNIFVIGNDAFGNGVLAVANCQTPTTETSVSGGYLRKTFTPEVFETFVNDNGTFNISPNPLVKIVGLDIEVSGTAAPVYLRNIRINNSPVSFDLKPGDQVGCLPIASPF